MLKYLEQYGRLCHKSEAKITKDSYVDFIKMLMNKQHESVLEHEKITVKVICSRKITHEIVRHRIGSYSQESTRYVNYKNKNMQFIKHFCWYSNLKEDKQKRKIWKQHMKNCEDTYKKLLELGAIPQEVNDVLPLALKTEIYITYNLRQWRHFFKMRCAKNAHPQIQYIAKFILTKFYDYVNIIFDDLYEQFIVNEK